MEARATLCIRHAVLACVRARPASVEARLATGVFDTVLAEGICLAGSGV